MGLFGSSLVRLGYDHLRWVRSSCAGFWVDLAGLGLGWIKEFLVKGVSCLH